MESCLNPLDGSDSVGAAAGANLYPTASWRLPFRNLRDARQRTPKIDVWQSQAFLVNAFALNALSKTGNSANHPP